MSDTESDRGSALIEFIFASVVLLIPLVYLALALAEVQSGAYAAASSAQAVARDAARHPDHASGNAHSISRSAFSDFGFTDPDVSIEFTCEKTCQAPGELVSVTVTANIPLPGIPQLFGSTLGASIPVSSKHAEVVAPL